MIRDLLMKYYDKIVIIIIYFPFIRNRLRKKMIDDLRDASRIMFVCKGNICRSPFAELYARKLSGKRRLSFSSSGFHQKSGRRSPETAVLASKEFRVNLSRHRSRTINESMVENSDIVFVFDEENLRNFRREFPEHAGKVHRIALLINRINIEDPYGGDESKFVGVYERIKRSVDSMMEYL
jgi:protein-tyrosine phosphatase